MDPLTPAPAVVTVMRRGDLIRLTVNGYASLYVDRAGALVRALRTCGRTIPLDRVPAYLMALVEALTREPLEPGEYLAHWEPVEAEE